MIPDPDCPSTSRHHSLRAHREAKCTCGSKSGGESWRRWQEYQQRHRAVDRRSAAERNARRDARKQEAQRAARVRFTFPAPGDFVGTPAHRELLSRPDLACRGQDPQLFEIEGQETTYDNRWRIVTARAVCGECPARKLCAQVAVADVDDHLMFRGGMTPGERQEFRTRYGTPKVA